ncbi:hypothetical protein [Paenibacillus antarcticus]|uniref:Uncharacterized protein n=1 Tax=Paenibacillus antarcticus TaxID=253703 RepID=A0A168L904_9BACL|nr:hypothetical protein [Paenibacillus antarcticus]OAB43044.1 hypothetical protein PBAT_18770 [Paenibacillus antarcticus]
MKNLLILFLLIILISGCSKDNIKKATDYLLINQENEISVVVFTNKSMEDSFIETLQQKIDYINNNLKIDKSITNVSFIDVREDQKYNYESIFDLKTYPQIILFENDEIVLVTTDSDELVRYYE